VRVPFGKFRGVGLADVPDDYLRWLHTLDDLREPLRSAVAKEYALRFEVAAGLPSLSPEIRLMAQELVSAGYRALARLHHPDSGGFTQVMQQVNLAAEWLRAAVRGVA
jgi:hypothetical protein